MHGSESHECVCPDARVLERDFAGTYRQRSQSHSRGGWTANRVDRRKEFMLVISSMICIKMFITFRFEAEQELINEGSRT
jgi:hypothetical protein